MNGRLDLRGRALQAPQNFRRREGDSPSSLYEVLLVALVELTFRRVGLVHTKDLRREVAEPVDKRSARKVCNQGGFRPIDKTSSN